MFWDTFLIWLNGIIPCSVHNFCVVAQWNNICDSVVGFPFSLFSWVCSSIPSPSSAYHLPLLLSHSWHLSWQHRYLPLFVPNEENLLIIPLFPPASASLLSGKFIQSIPFWLSTVHPCLFILECTSLGFFSSVLLLFKILKRKHSSSCVYVYFTGNQSNFSPHQAILWD